MSRTLIIRRGPRGPVGAIHHPDMPPPLAKGEPAHLLRMPLAADDGRSLDELVQAFEAGTLAPPADPATARSPTAGLDSLPMLTPRLTLQLAEARYRRALAAVDREHPARDDAWRAKVAAIEARMQQLRAQLGGQPAVVAEPEPPQQRDADAVAAERERCMAIVRRYTTGALRDVLAAEIEQTGEAK